MRQIITLALKDLKVMFRVKAALFFAIGWPVCIAVLFGLMFGGSSKTTKIPIAVVDEDRTAQATQFLAGVTGRDGFDVLRTDRAQAMDLIRRGSRSAAVVVPTGFGAAQGRRPHGAPPSVEMLVDPSRKVDASMLEGLLYAEAGQEMVALMMASYAGTPAGSATASPAVTTGGAPPTGAAAANAARAAWTPLSITTHDVSAERVGPRSSFDVSFVQGLVWGLIGCVMTFAVSLVSERTRGTFVRLRIAPLSAAQVLGGKALACFLALMIMQSLLLTIATAVFKVHVDAPLFLVVVMICAALAFVGIMMFVASLGKNEQAASGAGWAMLMPMSLFGGGMVPLAFMPAWMAPISNFSPIKWAVFGLEGAMWRGFSATDFLLPCGILLAVGLAGFAAGTLSLKRAGI
jgi:ABC-2 type transport system permease protein